ncbi:UPF0146 family protein [Natrialba magadii ATCC 43099]|uniref:UPF0146 protein Nmag_1553 n=1 Tax=Natrialba magadii (strain ATCC 43099 / DSM 3394 / CCM 3739 / CIP 104546 / IAM 13178 / JCM 8861 / NBRC 102185 / NCIMB 2190 / MS3) TaxID=547559 RepID=D3SU71_NATMM|nr:UPF0146 family protein [Natrialba magadii]ADD05129.1 UPF0146 family protein [Natrialba magadii ATCC 43099]ELY23167.1 hypothetical protein C500_20296 [Natrialba magadii ATCC 43099]
MGHIRRNRTTLTEILAAYDRLVEVGIGRRTDVAAALAERGCTVTATDIYDRDVPAGVRFVCDDIVDPNPSIYADADAIYARNLPPELHRPARDVARESGADLLFTTLGGDQPAIPVERRTIETGTVYVSQRS